MASAEGNSNFMQSWTVGEVKITAVMEGEPLEASTRFFLPTSTREEVAAIDWLRPHYVNELGRLILWVQAFVVETPTRRIVVDTCVGNDKPREGPFNMLRTDFLQRFEAAGFTRETIDVVLCTHLHVDHVGWNTMLQDGRWVPTFPNARYLMGKTELAYWATQTQGDDEAIYADSIQPVIDAGLVDPVEGGHVICDEVRLVATPGHTPGHVSVAIASKGEQAFITGDMMHTPTQIARPEWGSYVDYDTDASTATRRKVLAELADGPVLVIGTHFPAPTVGSIVRDGAGYRFKGMD
jgi:glyoxylase-like metal-dependent hydrolase (beta-lactamase superfamily II)